MGSAWDTQTLAIVPLLGTLACSVRQVWSCSSSSLWPWSPHLATLRPALCLSQSHRDHAMPMVICQDQTSSAQHPYR